MGFQAIGNKHLPDDRFNEPAYLWSPDAGLGSQIGSKLDACSANSAPIMAHTSHSFGPNSDYEDRADPTFWANVLKIRFHGCASIWLNSAISTKPCNMLAP